MQITDTPRKPSPGGRATHECCSDAPCDSGLRNHYFEGKRLTSDSFRVEQSYLVERRHLLNRAIHGWGVVYGYGLKPAAGQFEVQPGFALDECGRELVLTRAKKIEAGDVILLDNKYARLERPPEGSYETDDKKPHGPDRRACWLLSVHYAEQGVGPVKMNDPCSCERKEWDHVCETVRFSLRRVDCAECCKPHECELQCGCGTGACCEHHPRPEPHQDLRQDPYAKENPESRESTKEHAHAANPVQRGGCQCVCDHVTGLSDVECKRLCVIEEPCAQIRIDLRHGVPLACVSLREGKCDDWLFDEWVEACGPRRLVKRNDTLFDLIRGCDLTRISAIGWADWHRARQPIHWDDFKKSFGDETSAESGRNLTKYWVEFSRPVRKDTVRADCFRMTVVVPEDAEGWGEPRRVPILDVETVDAPAPLNGFITRATLVVDAGWVDDAIESRKKFFNQNPTTVEMEIRGDFIVDCNGQTVDANAVGLSPAPTGNGTPGGTFYSSFLVQPRDSRPRTPAYDNSYRAQGA
jgi:hypothetical protein